MLSSNLSLRQKGERQLTSKWQGGVVPAKQSSRASSAAQRVVSSAGNGTYTCVCALRKLCPVIRQRTHETCDAITQLTKSCCNNE
jgi:hypothetical protein